MIRGDKLSHEAIMPSKLLRHLQSKQFAFLLVPISTVFKLAVDIFPTIAEILRETETLLSSLTSATQTLYSLSIEFENYIAIARDLNL